YGVQAASKAYFGKNVDQLDLAEAAYLAGLIRSPETADASIDPSEADFRRDSVLDAMVEEAMITPEAAEEARSIPWTTMVLPRRDRSGLDIRFDRGCGMEYVIDWVRQQLLESYGNRIYTDGLRVHLTIDPERQCAAYDALYSQTLDDADTDPDASLVALDEQRNVVALVGGRDYSVSQVNLALGRLGGGSGRQAGSAFKPIVLAEAIRQGISPLSKYPAPAELVIPEADDGEDWKVTGGGSAGGGYTLLDATRVSSNTVYAQLMMEVGPENVANLARGLGITSELPPIPALVLGVPEVSVLDMASVYATLANAGEHLPPRIIDRVVGPGGALEPLPPREATFPLTQAETGEVTAALVDVVERGTGQQARLDLPAAGKTGTTDDYRDAWFVGYTCDLTAAVWMGYSGRDGQPVRSMRDVRSVDRVEGGTFPAQMWARFMSTAARGGEGCLYVDRDYDGRVLRPELSTSAPTEDSSASTTTETSSAAPTSTTAPAPAAPTSRPGSPSPSSSPPPTSSTTAPPATPVEPTTTGATTTTSPVPEPPSSTAGTTVSTVAAQPGAGPGG
ncbi:MAG: penicillin-binding transpeptidase domain-containing protein, partial [Acidimicrobiia bacterium]|nr:penicillin-binding transpeptidase domain-containing protein [Acidimicrobiia bacterium]